MTFQIKQGASVVGTSLKLYVDISPATVVATLGEPQWVADGKVEVEWTLVDDDGNVVTLYNYKTNIGRCESTADHAFHIGSHSKAVAEKFKVWLLNEAGFKTCQMSLADRRIAKLEETMREAYFALAGYRSPSLPKSVQRESLAKCHDLLAPSVYESRSAKAEPVYDGLLEAANTLKDLLANGWHIDNDWPAHACKAFEQATAVLEVHNARVDNPEVATGEWTTLRFTDGMTFDTTGPLRVVRKSDGHYYVVGQGMLCPVSSDTEGDALINQLFTEGGAA